MADQVRMKSKTVFQNDRVTVFRPGGPASGETRIPVTVGDEFETDPWHAGELVRAGHADLLDMTLDELPDAPLEPHHQVSVDDLRADRRRRAAGKPVSKGPALSDAGASGGTGDTTAAAVDQANRADAGAITETALVPPVTAGADAPSTVKPA